MPDTVAALDGHDFIVFGPWTANAAWTLEGPDGDVRVGVGGRLAVNQLHSVRHAAMAGFGVALLPRDWIGADLAAARLQQVLPDLQAPVVAMWAVYPSRKLVPATVRAFVDFLKERFAGGRLRPVLGEGG